MEDGLNVGAEFVDTVTVPFAVGPSLKNCSRFVVSAKRRLGRKSYEDVPTKTRTDRERVDNHKRHKRKEKRKKRK